MYIEEVTLYGATGGAVAYIDSDRESIYLWTGEAVCYLSGENVYGWNGSHLGWWRDGVIYDRSGYRVGFIRQRCPVAPYAAPAKNAKYARYVRAVRSAPFARPAFSMGTSTVPLRDFLRNGSVG